MHVHIVHVQPCVDRVLFDAADEVNALLNLVPRPRAQQTVQVAQDVHRRCGQRRALPIALRVQPQRWAWIVRKRVLDMSGEHLPVRGPCLQLRDGPEDPHRGVFGQVPYRQGAFVGWTNGQRAIVALDMGLWPMAATDG